MKKSYQERLDLMFQKHICRNCLVPGHYAKGCATRRGCDRPGCQKKHHALLHPPAVSAGNQELASRPTSYQASATVLNSATGAGRKRVCLRVVPVRVEGSSGQMVETYALLDDGSDVSLCDRRLLQQLGLNGVQRQFTLTTLSSDGKEQSGMEVSLKASSLDGNESLSLSRVWSVDGIPVSEGSIPMPDDVKRWAHLRDLNLPQIDERKVMLLIGGDCPDAFWVLDERRGASNEPYAVKFPLGWTLLGPVGPANPNQHFHVNFIRSQDEMLQLQVEKFWKTDFADRLAEPEVSLSLGDKQALKIMKEMVTMTKGHYQVGLPLRHRSSSIPNNRSLAESRLRLLRRRLLRDENLHAKYNATMNEYLTKGHAVKIPPDELPTDGKVVWYLPHHPVFHARKAEKVRVVFDCAAKYLGTSLNDQLLQGPDLNNNLIGVLMRFREENVAVVSDIESMFHQVRVDPSDCDALRFLWWQNGDLTSPPDEYKMVVHVFGATSSPSCTSFCLRKTAEDNEREFSAEIVNTVRRNFYVDDCLKSVRTTQVARKLVCELTDLLSRGGFRLTKWTSNDRQVLASIPESERAKSVINLDLDLDELPVERTLGVQWNVENDEFGFKVVAMKKPTTRRGILSVASSVYDPLGFLAPFTLSAKLMLQELCKKKIGWDEEIVGEELSRWEHWLADLPRLSEINVKRCYKPASFEEVNQVQLHHFSDASQYAYGAASYLRLVDADGNVHCSLVIGKSRLAPLKAITIPRLELSAAVVSVKLDSMIRRELDLPIGEELSVEEIVRAEREIIASVQQETFRDHFTQGSKSRSPLHKLCPVTIDGVLCVGGRLRNAPITEDAKHPILLPKKHHVTDLIVRKYHEELAHAGREHVLASVRLKFWIIKGRVAVRRVLRDCFKCRRRNAPTGEQRMANLPLERVTPDRPPFTFVGVDYFGPMLVKQKRSHVKRYGCLFTCLASRAVHIEIAHSLDTDSFIDALRRFIARRGRPEVMRSDNGTNFHGGEREL